MNVIELAHEAGFNKVRSYDFVISLERFAALVRAEALEEAAKVCEKAMIQMNYSEAPYKQCAAAIRGMK